MATKNTPPAREGPAAEVGVAVYHRWRMPTIMKGFANTVYETAQASKYNDAFAVWRLQNIPLKSLAAVYEGLFSIGRPKQAKAGAVVVAET